MASAGHTSRSVSTILDGRLVAIGKCPDNLRDALKVEKVLIDQDI